MDIERLKAELEALSGEHHVETIAKTASCVLSQLQAENAELRRKLDHAMTAGNAEAYFADEIMAERDAARGQLEAVQNENRLLRDLINLVQGIPSMGDKQLAELRANCEIVMAGRQ